MARIWVLAPFMTSGGRCRGWRGCRGRRAQGVDGQRDDFALALACLVGAGGRLYTELRIARLVAGDVLEGEIGVLVGADDGGGRTLELLLLHDGFATV